MFKLEFETDSAAFDGAEFPEIAEVLRKLADRIENPDRTEGLIRDSNGNTVGRWSMDLTAD